MTQAMLHPTRKTHASGIPLPAIAEMLGFEFKEPNTYTQYRQYMGIPGELVTRLSQVFLFHQMVSWCSLARGGRSFSKKRAAELHARKLSGGKTELLQSLEQRGYVPPDLTPFIQLGLIDDLLDDDTPNDPQ